MSSEQQIQTLTFFDRTADDWRSKAEGAVRKVNVIAERNRAVLAAARHEATSNILDVGCGTGELVVQHALEGRTAVGIDFSAEMIAHCEQLKASESADKATFHTVSVFDFEAPPASFDLISGLGLIEYLSPQELDTLVGFCRQWLAPGGRVALGSRNRLFNLHSLNEYTSIELSLGTAEQLLAEAVALAEATDVSAVLADHQGSADLPHPTRHPGTGIGVETRYQYTPAGLAARLRVEGFERFELVPVHFHALPVAGKSKANEIHIQLAEAVVSHLEWHHSLIPFSSSFVMIAEKTED